MGALTVVACEMLEHEVRAAAAETGLGCPIVWIERELHNHPDRLRRELQRQIDRSAAETVLLAFTQCGNAAVGLEARECGLVLPRFADCVHLFRSRRPGDPGDVDMRTLYTSPGFLEGRSGIFREYDRCCARHGPEKARRICRLMVQHYRAVRLMDTGAADPAVYAPRAQELARLLDLEYGTCCGTYRVLRKLFAGQWDDEFVVVPQGGIVREEAFRPALDFDSRDGAAGPDS